jgi:hypothetical protein
MHVQALMKQAGAWQLASGVTPFYLVRCIPRKCSLRTQWLEACAPPCDANNVSDSWAALTTTALFLPSPLKFLVAPEDFSKLWFPGGRWDTGRAESSAQNMLWRRFKNCTPMDTLSAICTEGVCPILSKQECHLSLSTSWMHNSLQVACIYQLWQEMNPRCCRLAWRWCCIWRPVGTILAPPRHRPDAPHIHDTD